MVSATKRQRTEETHTEETPEVVRSTIWLDDGSIIIQVENTQFRVHRSILAKNSRVFNDMNTLAQPEDANSVDGCPSVVMHGDSVEDWTHLLSVLYHITTLPMSDDENPPGALIAALMRLGRKYQFDSLRRQACHHLIARVPRNLEEVEKLVYDAGFQRLGHWATTVIPDILPLIQERGSGVESLLPVMYFLAFMPSFEEYHGKPYYEKLALPGLETLVKGYTDLTQYVPEYNFEWAIRQNPDDADCIPSQNCVSLRECRTKSNNLLVMLFGQLPSIINFVFAPWDYTTNTLKLCPPCQVMAKDSFNLGRTLLWQRLPEFFGLDDWERLKKVDAESLSLNTDPIKTS